MSESAEGVPHDGASRLAIGVLVAAMALASVVVWASVLAPEAARLAWRSEKPLANIVNVAAGPATPARVDRGAALAREQCAGCHAASSRLVGPSWHAIAEKYAALAASDSICGDGRGLVGSGASHPLPSWNGYPPGPADIALSSEDRAALGAWVISTAKGAGK